MVIELRSVAFLVRFKSALKQGGRVLPVYQEVRFPLHSAVFMKIFMRSRLRAIFAHGSCDRARGTFLSFETPPQSTHKKITCQHIEFSVRQPAGPRVVIIQGTSVHL